MHVDLNVFGTNNVQLLQCQRMLRISQVTNEFKHFSGINDIAIVQRIVEVRCRVELNIDIDTRHKRVGQMQKIAIVVMTTTLHCRFHCVDDWIRIQRHC